MGESKRCLRCDRVFPARGVKAYCSEDCRKRAETARRQARQRRLRSPKPPRVRVRDACRDCGTSVGMDWWVGRGYKFNTEYTYQFRCAGCTSRSPRASACVECGAGLPARRTKFCSDDCHLASRRLPLRDCCDCGAKIVGSGIKRCRECAAAWRRSRPARAWRRSCDRCGVRYTTTKSRRFCSDTCRDDVPLRPPSPGLLQLGPTRVPCRTCGVAFAKGVRRRYCSRECAYARHAERIMGLYRAAYETGRVKHAMHWRFELVEYLRDRDGDDCRLCGDRMNFDASTGPRGESDEGATVDHVVPWSLSRDDSLSNLQLAHWSCNRAKSDGCVDGGEQLRLVG